MSRFVLDGVVTSNACAKTVTVLVTRRIMHPKYKKYVNITKKYHAHDEGNKCNVGDRVIIRETNPISKTKCWIVVGNGVNGSVQS
ncbi:MAG: 30S ribosomal protein S17 [Holosporaceae bacterium]|jgi:small subunit ribosomal protein S17|nr:30S ribosomal protein S17 [Holosporaceae bacterium]